MLTRVSTWCFDHRFAAVGLWLLGFVAIITASGLIGPAYSGALDFPDSESADGFAVLDEYFADLGVGAASGTIVFRAETGVDDPAVVAEMEALFAEVDAGFPDETGEARYPGATIVSPYGEQGVGQIAVEGPLAGKVAYAQVNLDDTIGVIEASELGGLIGEHVVAVEGLEIYAGGTILAEFEPPETEFIGLAFAIVVLIVAFGSVLAMGLPIAVALGGVGAGIGSIVLLSNVVTMPDFTLFLAVMIGLGVGIDYALFIVTRYREGLADGLDPRQATLMAMDTAGRAVIFAGVTVVISMIGLLLVGLDWIAGMGLGISATVLATMITSITLLPALLALAGERVDVTRWRGLLMAGFAAVALLGVGVGQPTMALVGAALAAATLALSFVIAPLRRTVPRRQVKPMSQTFAYRWSRTIQRRPWLWLGLGATLLLLLSAPLLSIRLGFSDEGNFSEETTTRKAYDLLAEGFGPGFNSPFLITVVPDLAQGDETTVAVIRLQEALVDAPGVAAVSPAFPNNPANPTAYLMSLVPDSAPQDEATTELVTGLRDDVIPLAVSGTGLDVKVTGMAAANIDSTGFIVGRLVVFLGAVLALSFVLLMMVFRSVLVPVKAVIMNVLSISAAYGLVVAVFQWGWAGDLLGVDQAPIEPMVPLMLFAIVFGLSMDYEVFLLSRVREEYLRSGDSAASVANGLASTARVISAAAAIMVVVFGSFLFEDDRITKLFGTGLAAAVLFDATLVRMLLVPATMELLGSRNWWMPRWLDRLIPELNIEGGQHSPDNGLGTDGLSNGELGDHGLPNVELGEHGLPNVESDVGDGDRDLVGVLGDAVGHQ